MRTSRVALDTGVTHDSPIASRSRHPVGEHSKDLRKNAGHFKVMVEVTSRSRSGFEVSVKVEVKVEARRMRAQKAYSWKVVARKEGV